MSLLFGPVSLKQRETEDREVNLDCSSLYFSGLVNCHLRYFLSSSTTGVCLTFILPRLSPFPSSTFNPLSPPRLVSEPLFVSRVHRPFCRAGSSLHHPSPYTARNEIFDPFSVSRERSTSTTKSPDRDSPTTPDVETGHTGVKHSKGQVK